MHRSLVAVAIVVTVALTAVAGAALGVPLAAGSSRAAAAPQRPIGSPAAGKALFSSLGCGGCHAVDPAATTPTTGPLLTRATLTARAREAGRPLGPFVAESIVSPVAEPSPGWVSAVMRSYAELRPAQLDHLVSYLTGSPYRGSGPAGVPLPANPAKACDARAACRAQVARWTRQLRLPSRVVPGAKTLAVAGCLSCHSFAGAGVTGAAPELTAPATYATGVPALTRWIRCARCVEPSVAMPSFTSLSVENARRIAELLVVARSRS